MSQRADVVLVHRRGEDTALDTAPYLLVHSHNANLKGLKTLNKFRLNFLRPPKLATFHTTGDHQHLASNMPGQAV